MRRTATSQRRFMAVAEFCNPAIWANDAVAVAIGIAAAAVLVGAVQAHDVTAQPQFDASERWALRML